MRPNRQIVLRFAARGVQLWLLVRLMGSAVLALASANPLHIRFMSAVALIVACVAVGIADMHRRHESVLLANLAVSRADTIAFFAIPAMVGEGIVAALGSTLH